MIYFSLLFFNVPSFNSGKDDSAFFVKLIKKKFQNGLAHKLEDFCAFREYQRKVIDMEGP